MGRPKHIKNMTLDEKVVFIAGEVKGVKEDVVELSIAYHAINENVTKAFNFSEQRVKVQNGGGMEIEINLDKLLAKLYETIKVGGTHDVACGEKFCKFSEELDGKYNITKNMGKWYGKFDIWWKWVLRIGAILLILAAGYKYLYAKGDNNTLLKDIIILKEENKVLKQTVKILAAPTRSAIIDTIRKDNTNEAN
jgi:hypothetical protein